MATVHLHVTAAVNGMTQHLTVQVCIDILNRFLKAFILKFGDTQCQGNALGLNVVK